MKAKLYKVLDQYHLYDGDKAIATTIVGNPMLLPNLSKQNCDEIFGVVDVEKLASEYANKRLDEEYTSSAGNFQAFSTSFTEGFNKAMELNKDKVFTEDDVNLAFVLGKNKDESRVNKLINSRLQPTEMDVEIVMEEISSTYLVTIGEVKTTRLEPKLDSEGCLILKKI